MDPVCGLSDKDRMDGSFDMDPMDGYSGMDPIDRMDPISVWIQSSGMDTME